MSRARYWEGYTYQGRKIALHSIVAEKALGKPLPKGAAVHHVDGNGRDNRNTNLVICQNAAYHNLLHLRMAAHAATGDPTRRRCQFCRVWDAPSNLVIRPNNNSTLAYHAECRNRSRRTEYSVKRFAEAVQWSS